MRVVVTAITLETVGAVSSILNEFPVEQEEIIQMSVSRAKKAGRYHLMQAENPVFILSFYFAKERRSHEDTKNTDWRDRKWKRKDYESPGALLEILKRQGKKVQAFKCGPDYIDPMFHRTVLGIPSKNLDTFFTGEKMTAELFMESAVNAGYLCDGRRNGTV